MAFLPWLFRNRPSGGSSSRSGATSFQYMPLQDNCIRLVRLQPRRTSGRTDVIECTLSSVAFVERPVYDALSYAWGDGRATRTIIVNGTQFEVGENLAAALINIRGLESAGEQSRTLWIDAICINQSDNAERSRQVQIMPEIYARANLVLIWLGARTTFKVHCAEEENSGSDLPKHSSTNKMVHGRIESHVVVNLCRRQYWKRLWIIQEIGKAHKLRIHYYSTTTQWGRFIENVKSQPELADSIPLRLEAQLRGQHGTQLTLSNLLRNNQGALCKDPRDKIYGLLGLAIDVDNGFPIDYAKSVFEVFTDAIFLQNNDEGRSQHDILEITRLVARMMGGPEGLKLDVPAGRSLHAGDFSIESTNAQARRLHVQGRLVGRVVHIGPLHHDVVAQIPKSDEWKSLIRNYISELELRAIVLEQSELFRWVLRQFKEESQTTIFPFDPHIWWNGPQQLSVETIESGRTVGPDVPRSTDSSSSGCRLFLLQPPASSPTASWMGLAPPGTQVGDFVCHIHSIERAVIVRQSHETGPASAQNQYLYSIIGCAGLARDRDAARELQESLRPDELFVKGISSSLAESERLDLYMDINTAYEISR